MDDVTCPRLDLGPLCGKWKTLGGPTKPTTNPFSTMCHFFLSLFSIQELVRVERNIKR